MDSVVMEGMATAFERDFAGAGDEDAQSHVGRVGVDVDRRDPRGRRCQASPW